MEKKFVITIGRQFGSGGSEVGYRLSQEMGIAYYDKDLIVNAAKESGMSEHVFEMEDEKASGSFLYSMALAPHAAAANFLHWSDETVNDRIFKAQANYIRKVADQGSCVIVGRCADYILWDRENVFRIFLHSDMAERKRRIAEASDVTPAKAEDIIRKKDKTRSNYYSFHTNNRWTELTNYDLCLNTAKIGIEGAVQVIKAMVENKLS